MAASCWRNSLKLNYNACPFIKYRWHSFDRFLQWLLRREELRNSLVFPDGEYWLCTDERKMLKPFLTWCIHLLVYGSPSGPHGKRFGKWRKRVLVFECSGIVEHVHAEWDENGEQEVLNLWSPAPASGQAALWGPFMRHATIMDWTRPLFAPEELLQ